MTRDPTSLVIGSTPVTIPVSLASMPKAVHVSVVDADVAGSLLKVVKGVYAPAVLRNDAWPRSVKDELSAHTHRYLAGLTERAHELRGETVLYVPEEPSLLFLTTARRGDTTHDASTRDAIESEIERAARDEELTRRLESVVIHWTRQIREVVRETDGGESGADRYGGGGAHAAGRDVMNETAGKSRGVAEEDASDGPLAEVAFWHARARPRRHRATTGRRRRRRDRSRVAKSALDVLGTLFRAAFDRGE